MINRLRDEFETLLDNYLAIVCQRDVYGSLLGDGYTIVPLRD